MRSRRPPLPVPKRTVFRAPRSPRHAAGRRDGEGEMEILEKSKIKWTYVTHAVDRAVVTGLAPMSAKTDPGALVLGRVRQVGKHKEIEGVDGRRVTLFPGDVIAGVLGHRYATDQYEGEAIARGPLGHLLGIGGVCGEVVGRNEKMPDPTVLEWVGRPTDAKGSP